jgi:hypothetical protein
MPGSTSIDTLNRDVSRKNHVLASLLVSQCLAKGGRYAEARSVLEEALGCTL